MSIPRISNITRLYESEIHTLRSLKEESENTIKKIISDNISTALHALLEDEHLLEIIGAYLTAGYESGHCAAIEVSNILIAYNKSSSKNKVIGCNYLPVIFLKAIEDKLGKLREKLYKAKAGFVKEEQCYKCKNCGCQFCTNQA